MIYFAHAVGTDLVKIGFTAGDPAKRLKELQTGCPQRLELLAAIDGTEADEERWHKDFERDRAHGEWFKLTPRMTLAVARSQAIEALSRVLRGEGEEQLVEKPLLASGYIDRTNCFHERCGRMYRDLYLKVAKWVEFYVRETPSDGEFPRCEVMVVIPDCLSDKQVEILTSKTARLQLLWIAQSVVMGWHSRTVQFEFTINSAHQGS